MEILTLGEKIRRRRKSLRLTLKDVAGDSVTPAQLSYVESDKCKPSSGLLKYICSKIDLDMDYVLEEKSEQAKKYCDYYIKEYEFYIRRGEHEEAEEKLLKVERLAEEYGLDRYRGIISYRKGINLLQKGEYDLAQHNFLTALQVFMKLGEEGYKADCYYNLGKTALNRDYTDDALVFFTYAFEGVNSMDKEDHLKLYKICMALAEICLMTGKFQEYETRICEAIREARETKDAMIIADALKNAALMTCSPSKLAQCDDYIDEAADIYKGNKQYKEIPKLLALKAYMHTRFADYDAGVTYAEDVLKHEDAKEDSYTTGYLLKTIDLMLNGGYVNGARNILESIESGFDGELEAEYLYLKARTFKDVDDAKYREYLEMSADCMKRMGCQCMIIKVTDAIGQSYIREKKYSKALEYLMESAKLYDLEVV